MSGNEIPFIDAGFESVVLNESNYLDSPRMICSRVNENSKLNTISGNKSMNLRLFLNTTNSRVSPVIDLERVSTILTSNRVNSVIDDYSIDSRVMELMVTQQLVSIFPKKFPWKMLQIQLKLC